MVATRTRLMAGAAGAVVAGGLLVAAPPAATSAEAANRINVKKAAKVQQLRKAVVKTARNLVGSCYVFGSAGPNSFDCSGLVHYSYRKATGKSLPRTSHSQRASLKRVSAKNRKPGDLVFFNGNGHVAIYIGKNKIVHAARSGRGVRIDSISGWYSSTLGGYSRVVQRA